MLVMLIRLVIRSERERERGRDLSNKSKRDREREREKEREGSVTILNEEHGDKGWGTMRQRIKPFIPGNLLNQCRLDLSHF